MFAICIAPTHAVMVNANTILKPNQSLFSSCAYPAGLRTRSLAPQVIHHKYANPQLASHPISAEPRNSRSGVRVLTWEGKPAHCQERNDLQPYLPFVPRISRIIDVFLLSEQIRNTRRTAPNTVELVCDPKTECITPCTGPKRGHEDPVAC